MSKRILMLTHEFPPMLGGIATYASQLARAAHEIGHSITVLAPDSTQNYTRTSTKHYSFPVIRFSGAIYRAKSFLPLLLRVSRIVKSGDYDIIHTVDWPHILALAFLNRIRRIPFAATVYGTELLSMPTARQVRWMGLSDFFARPDQIFAISKFTRNLYFDVCPNVPPDRLRITPLGADYDWSSHTGTSFDVREKYEIPANHKIILTASRLDERKGHRTTLRAMSLLSKTMQEELTYVITGTGNDPHYVAELHDLAQTSNVRVLFVGAIERNELHALYSAASLFCMPGEPHHRKVEGFGLVYLEAGAHGLPAVATRVGAVGEVVLNQKTGLMVEPCDAQAVANAIETLLQDDDLRMKYGAAAREYARQFSWKRCAENTYGNV